MRLILSRKGFDSRSGGCPSPIFSDGSMLSMPIPLEPSSVRYEDLQWRGRNLGDLVEKLTKRRIQRAAAAHLDPDLRPEMRPRRPGWRASLGQHKAAHGHLRKNGVSVGDLFLFWGLFRTFDEQTGWSGNRRHVIWGWLQIGEVASVDAVIRPALARGEQLWAEDHPHLAFEPDASNTLYVAAEKLSVPGEFAQGLPGAGAFDFEALARQLTKADAETPLTWSLPLSFLPEHRSALSYHQKPERWTVDGDRVLLTASSRGQEFILDCREYPKAIEWVAGLLAGVREAN